MAKRFMFKVGVVVMTAALVGACSSDGSTDSANPTEQSGSGDTLAPADPATSGGTDDAGTTADVGSATDVPEEGVEDLCSTIPDLAAIEAAIGVPVKDPLGVGDPGFQQTCTLLRATDDFPGISFTLVPGGTIAGQIEFVKTNFDIDIVPLEGADGFYAGEGDSVYWEGNGSLYQVQASIDGDSQTASLNLLEAWLLM